MIFGDLRVYKDKKGIDYNRKALNCHFIHFIEDLSLACSVVWNASQSVHVFGLWKDRRGSSELK